MSDLHLSKKPWQVRKALKMGENAHMVLLVGDLTNDGTPEQLANYSFWTAKNTRCKPENTRCVIIRLSSNKTWRREQ